ncbi:hypothetical protein DCAR_0414745 [Daucus carota subsp. sativus]|uniref:DUF659 domain-containing protein n=1 Tax=Daucus carota subsp. sativus TaxID=79200 RepID=A0AAF0WV22_DAUCS|nr:hypothetical protein DCAR_0414745 [Daucus carota subsp. sativus]
MASDFHLSSYVPPTYNALRTTLLQKERANVERLLIPIKTTWKEKGVEPQNVVQVITGNAPVCKVVGIIIETSFPHIFWTPCVVHTLKLALKNICDAKNSEANREVYDECYWIIEVADAAILIKNFIFNHNMVNTMFSLFAPLKLLCVAETRFASFFTNSSFNLMFLLLMDII